MPTLTAKRRTVITVLLLLLALWDFALWIVTFFYPELWMDSVHGQPMADPMGLLPRTGAMWLAFAIFQFVAFLRWKRAPFWLCFVAGMRLSELLADWTYLGFAESLTTTGRVSLLVTPLMNIAISVLFLWAYFRAREEERAHA
ncbi:MAG: hypothetical protein ACRELC_06710 [Gemmatimonadota bacterium]